ncbi:hypothetical protein BJ322DRAFT_1019309 [Thelephora terrestris]|uniref:Uncharacterized protein n=1 Tax=Thelephora terrestris TaxID=56493 RepID=A0A9P6HGE4_9AGAM|nr:hypothetical protein BJ322DRAFT_1019309 [Thelephora terrestris]
MKNVQIATVFALITVVQLVFGIYITIITAKRGGEVSANTAADTPRRVPPVHIHPESKSNRGRLPKSLPVLWIGDVCAPDALAFVVIIFQARRSRVPGLKVSNILNTIAEDSTRYFIVIFTSHFVLVMTLNLGRVTIQNLPGTTLITLFFAMIRGILVYLPLMISRIMLSLKKAADSTRTPWSLTQDTRNGHAVRSGLVFGRPPIGDEDTEISLDTFQEP